MSLEAKSGEHGECWSGIRLFLSLFLLICDPVYCLDEKAFFSFDIGPIFPVFFFQMHQWVHITSAIDCLSMCISKYGRHNNMVSLGWLLFSQLTISLWSVGSKFYHKTYIKLRSISPKKPPNSSQNHGYVLSWKMFKNNT